MSAGRVGGDVHQIQAGRDVIETHVHQGLSREEVEGLIQARIAELKSELVLPMHVELARLPGPEAVEVAVDGFGIVRAFDLEGSRVHLDFYLANDSQQLVSLAGLTLTVNGCLLRMKQFFTRDGQLRTPDPGAALREVANGGFERISVEFENTGAAIVYSQGIRGELAVDLAGGQSIVGTFGTGPLALKAVFDEMDGWSREHQSPLVFDVPIEPAKR